jgi:hypothetical protein
MLVKAAQSKMRHGILCLYSPHIHLDCCLLGCEISSTGVGRFVVRCGPSVFSDIAISIVLAFFFWCLVMIIASITQAIYVSCPYTMKEMATAAALALVPPVLVALFKGTEHARSLNRPSD